ncbi:LamG-like jellyroll fold domain-containing protein [Methylomonas sp. ZR1]|uniref:LamG-like jellyroll fold domain-containing protein n=1 Tax=Methylomonas sp. ZR1 TaxID=1797072 RepID=UPI001491E6F2|nr:LamG-like jellyroll fold domain-containing protein [Methylomonas sp. ZR1]NOV32498.1 hypothetical protein [Methylomonas sp. ZR1]
MNGIKRKTLSTIACLLALLGLFSPAAQAETGNVVLWNKLGSDAEIANSEVGPGGQKTAGHFAPGPFANFGQSFVNDAGNSNVFALTFPATSVVSKSKGTIEFWAKLSNFPSNFFDAVTMIFYVPPPNFPIFHWRIGFGSNNGCGGFGFYGTVGVATDGYCNGLVDTATQSGTLDSILGDRSAWHHYAMVWNETGIAQFGGRKLYLYLDGNLVTTQRYHDASPWGAIPDGSRLALAYFYNISGASVAIDNLIVWDDVKTDFSDRFIENPVGCGVAELPELFASITAKSGTQTERRWTITLSNKSGCIAENTQIDDLTLTQTSGAACTPVITSPLSFPLGVGNIQAGAKVSGTTTINFSGCPNSARFKAVIPFSSNNGEVTGSKTLTNQFR